MVQNVQCPVCTLFLHAGMNLSDHLETHPKEQVIKALVQMIHTGSDAADAALANVFLGKSSAKKNETTPLPAETKPTAKSDGELSKDAPKTQSDELKNVSNTNQTAKLLSVASLAASIAAGTKTQIAPPTGTVFDTSSSSETPTTQYANSTNPPDRPKSNEVMSSSTLLKPVVVETCDFPKNEQLNHTRPTETATTTTICGYQTLRHDFSSYNENRYEQQQHKQIETTENQMPQPNTQSSDSALSLQPPPPLPPPPAISTQLRNTYNSGPTQSAPFYQQQHQQQRQQNYNQQQQQQHHPAQTSQHYKQPGAAPSANLKLIYSPALPPPPPLQLFTHQTTQHQKPPPAYGTAISQIRSQNNQNRQQQHHQQHQQQQIAINQIATPVIPPNVAALPTTTTTTTPATAVKQQFSQHKLNAEPVQLFKNSGETHVPSTSQTIQLHAQSQFFQPPPPPPMSQQQAHPIHLQKVTSPAISITTPISATSSQKNNANPSSSTALIRQTSSPFSNAQASPSSVLRYAESPVAHYLERENGDFIVQETPKHIVECVEKDNGEFSVIERIYHSPPSVLHIHDDDDGDDDGDDEGEELPDSSCLGNNGKQMHMSAASTSNKKRQTKTMKKSQCNSVAARNKRPKSHRSEDEEFMSLSSETESYSEDEHDKVPQNQQIARQRKTSVTLQQNQVLPLSTAPSTSSAASAAIANDGSNNNCGKSTTTTTTNSSNGQARKSKKNMVTVLSDVPLNMSEYLDLVGNILASNKFVNQSPFATLAPIPLVKVEKEEPVDDYEQEMQCAQEELEDPPTTPLPSSLTNTPEPIEPTALQTELTRTIPPPILPNETETEAKLVGISVNKLKQKQSNDDNEEQQQQQLPPLPAHENPTSSIHFTTSVIRMASTAGTTTTTAHSTFEKVQQLQQQQQQQSVPSQISTEQESAIPEDLTSQTMIKVEVSDTTTTTSLTPQKFATSSIKQQRGPKKLIIKPKSSSSSSYATTTNSNAQKTDVDYDSYDNVASTSTAAAAAVAVAFSRSFVEGSSTSTTTQADARTNEFVFIKKENASNAFDDPSSSGSGGGSILEKHLKSTTIPNVSNGLKFESNQNLRQIDEDAQVILDFAKSKPVVKKAAEPVATAAYATNEVVTIENVTSIANTITNFPSANSMFSSSPAVSGTKTTSNGLDVVKYSEEYILPDNNNEINEIVISSSYSSQSAVDVRTTQQPQSQKPQSEMLSAVQGLQSTANNFNDYHFSYHAPNIHVEPFVNESLKNSMSFTPFAYQQQLHQHQHSIHHDATNAATVASSSLISTSSSLIDDSFSRSSGSRLARERQSVASSNTATAGSVSWYQLEQQQQPDFNAALAVDCSAAVDGVQDAVGNKYLDLDTCKRESGSNSNSHIASHLLPSSASTSSSGSFITGGTECSLAGGCTGDALNIRTDEKMPAKGEISEQESNCDIENSWSQSMYGDISARLFRTSFPGVYPQENGWHNDEYFTVQDLSASNVANEQIKATKSFDFRLPLDGTTAAVMSHTNTVSTINGNNGHNLLMFPHDSHTDAIPSTSTNASKQKKRKRVAQNTAAPTSTITSQQMLLQQQHQQEQQQEQQNITATSAEMHQPQPTTSAALLAGPSTGFPAVIAAGGNNNDNQIPNATLTLIEQQRRQNKIYKCDHCESVFNKLKDRTAHLITEHNYVRKNRRLVRHTNLVTTTTVELAASSSAANIPNSELVSMKYAVAVASSSEHILTSQDNNEIGMASSSFNGGIENVIEDQKHHIVKIKMENCSEQQLTHSITTLDSTAHGNMTLSMNEHCVHATKTELADVKDASLTASTSSAVNGIANSDNTSTTTTDVDTKPNLQKIYLRKHLPTSKLFTLYRMLTAYNLSKLKHERDLTEMERKVLENSIFLCYICHTDFPSVKLYDAHLTEHPAQCFTCGKKFYRWKNFSLHLKRHMGWKEFGCYVCDKKFVVRSSLVEHMRTHTGQTPYKCVLCGKRFKRYSNLTQHRKRHTKQVVRKKEYVCHCGEVLPSKARYLWHKETHDSKPKCCPYCCDRFVHANSLRRHIRLAHSDKFDYTEPMECPMCKQIFAKTSIKAHMATHSISAQYDCTICTKTFSTKWNLKMHLWVHANRTAKPFKCEHCPKAFVRELDFKNHMNSHKQIKPYTCEYCGCKFIRKYNYMRHRREHHGNKKFTCDLCDKSFHRHYYLIEHRRIHTGERPFQCTICGKSSTTKTNHNKHLKIHHSRDPFTVEV